MPLSAATLPIVQDLPIGIDPGGFDAWEWQDLLALDVSVGAPPDEFNRSGQDWGLPPFVPWRLRDADYEPFAATVRASGNGGPARHFPVARSSTSTELVKAAPFFRPA